MSILDRGNADIIIFPEILATDEDGNPRTMASATGVPARAMIQLRAQSGTSARRAEQDNEGYETESVYRMRLTRASQRAIGMIGSQAEIEWNGQRWSIIGDVQRFEGSRRTKHYDYTIRRT